MKKFLFLFAAIVLSLTVFSQVTVTIEDVKTVDTKGPYVQDIVTYTISAVGYEVYGAGVSGEINGQKGWNAGLWNPHVASNTAGTYSVVIWLTRKQSRETRVYYSWAWIDPLEGTPDTGVYYVTSDRYTVTK